MPEIEQPLRIEDSRRFTPRFDSEGLIPCITVDASDGEVLMFAWMNAESLRKTLETGFVHYWSRSRRTIWMKGETSGSTQRVVDLRTDCDQDVLLVRAAVEMRAHTCHTGRVSCFYRSIPLGGGSIEREFSSMEDVEARPDAAGR
jgi:phosphoribosyl-AMP cyclohydrolase